MDTLTLFPLEEFGQESSLNDEDGIGSGLEEVPAQDRIDDRAGISEEQEADSTEIAVPNPQDSSGSAGESAGVGGQVAAEETSSIYEATGLTGPFKLSLFT